MPSTKTRPLPVASAEFKPNLDAVIDRKPTYYVINGRRYRRVTTAVGIINKPGLAEWGRSIGLAAYHSALSDQTGKTITPELLEEIKAVAEVRNERARGRGADLGTQTHEYVERFIDEGPVVREEVPPELLPAVDGAVAFIEDMMDEIICTERTVWSEEDGNAGTFDVLGIDKHGRLAIVDWKRAKGIYYEHEVQIGAYGEYLYQTTGMRPDVGYVVRLPQEPVGEDEPLYGLKEVRDLEELYEDYRAALRLYLSKSERERKRRS